MVMTRYGVSFQRRLVKVSSNSKGKTFDEKGLAIDPMDVEPLNSTPPATLVPYGTSEDEITIAKGFRDKVSYPLENQNSKSLNLEDNLVQTPTETVGNDTETKADPFWSEGEFVGFLRAIIDEYILYSFYPHILVSISYFL